MGEGFDFFAGSIPPPLLFVFRLPYMREERVGDLEFKLGFHIDLAACEIVWHCILVVGDISHPII